MHGFATTTKCTQCGHIEPVGVQEHVCSVCGGIRDVEYDYDAIAARLTRDALAADPRRDIRRYLDLLPVDPAGPMTPLPVGGTPIVEAPRLAAALGVRRLWLKDDGRNPTGSFKDRASFVGTARAAAAGHRIVAAASTGNAATSLAGLAASMGLRAHIFVPASAPEAKIAQLLVYGAEVFLIDADYDTTYDVCQQAVRHFEWYDRSAAVNPYLVEGKKTCGLEIAEQMQDDLPDWVAMSVGDGCSLAGTHKGLAEMCRLGLSDRVPRMLGVQAEGAAPLTKAYRAHTEELEHQTAHSLADSINVGVPRNPIKVLRAVRASEGEFVNVSDEAILDHLARTAQGSGVFGEPAAVAAVAGIEAARSAGTIGANDTVLAVISGSGLKDVRTAMQAVQRPAPLPPTLDAVTRRLDEARSA